MYVNEAGDLSCKSVDVKSEFQYDELFDLKWIDDSTFYLGHAGKWFGSTTRNGDYFAGFTEKEFEHKRHVHENEHADMFSWNIVSVPEAAKDVGREGDICAIVWGQSPGFRTVNERVYLFGSPDVPRSIFRLNDATKLAETARQRYETARAARVIFQQRLSQFRMSDALMYIRQQIDRLRAESSSASALSGLSADELLRMWTLIDPTHVGSVPMEAIDPMKFSDMASRRKVMEMHGMGYVLAKRDEVNRERFYFWDWAETSLRRQYRESRVPFSRPAFAAQMPNQHINSIPIQRTPSS